MKRDEKLHLIYLTAIAAFIFFVFGISLTHFEQYFPDLPREKKVTVTQCYIRAMSAVNEQYYDGRFVPYNQYSYERWYDHHPNRFNRRSLDFLKVESDDDGNLYAIIAVETSKRYKPYAVYFGEWEAIPLTDEMPVPSREGREPIVLPDNLPKLYTLYDAAKALNEYLNDAYIIRQQFENTLNYSYPSYVLYSKNRETPTQISTPGGGMDAISFDFYEPRRPSFRFHLRDSHGLSLGIDYVVNLDNLEVWVNDYSDYVDS